MPCPTPSPSNLLHLWEMLDRCASLALLLTQCHVDFFFHFNLSGALYFGNVNIYILSFNASSGTIEN